MTVKEEIWPLARTFTLSRGSRTQARVVLVEIEQEGNTGRGECVPYPRYGESPRSAIAAIAAHAAIVEAGASRRELGRAMPPGAARNAIDCALWDLEAKLSHRPVYALAGLPAPSPAITAYTISLATPRAMAEATRDARGRALLKIKLGGDGDCERIAAVREAAGEAELIVDANEAWRKATFQANLDACAKAGVKLIEQPFPAGEDEALSGGGFAVPLCADESFHVAADLEALRSKYDAVNIKLDKTGGLSEALATLSRAEDHGFQIMIGCMVGTSLAMAPAFLLAARARFVDLDGPLLLAHDREHGLAYDGSLIEGYGPALWG